MRDITLNVASSNKNILLTCFAEGKEAIKKLAELAKQKKQLPGRIFMDYTLDSGVKNPKFSKGTEVISEIIKVCKKNNISLPEITAFSSESHTTNELIKAGANNSFDKKIDKIVNYLKSYKGNLD